MNPMTSRFDAEFVDLLLHSPTFWNTAGLWMGLSVLLALSLLYWLRCRACRQCRAVAGDTSGAAGAVDMVLTLPIFIVIVLLIVQFAILANGALIVHYAAYTAARSARVYNDKFVCLLYLQSRPNLCRQQQAVYERAARFALIAASSSNPYLRCRGNCEVPESILATLVAASGNPQNRADNVLKVAGFSFRSTPARALLRKARYAFDSGNSKINVTTPPLAYLPAVQQGGQNADGAFSRVMKAAAAVLPVVTAKVSFDLHMLLPVGRLIPGTQQREQDGHYYKTATAEVTLL